MRRREFITLLGGAALVWPLVARAQQHATDGMRQIGMLVPRAATDPEAQRFVNTLAQALEHLGWTDGRNIRIDHGWNSGGDPEQARALRGASSRNQ
jgi:putative tryptophan/tyrosine transport system substrate-binding protein